MRYQATDKIYDVQFSMEKIMKRTIFEIQEKVLQIVE